MTDKTFIIMIDEFYYAGESEDPANHKTSGSGWHQSATQASGIKLVDSLEDAKVMEGLTNLNSHWKRIYDALRYKELDAMNICFMDLSVDYEVDRNG